MTKPKPKRTKPYRPRAVNVPMMSETHRDLALTLRMLIETLIAAPSIDAYNAVSLQLVTLGRVLGPQQYLEDAKRAMLDIVARLERVGKVGVSGPEAVILRTTAGSMDAAIALVPVNKFAAAEVKTARWCRANGF